MPENSNSSEGQKARHLEQTELLSHAKRLLGEYVDELRSPDIASQVPADYLDHKRLENAHRFHRGGAEWLLNYYKLPDQEDLTLQRRDEKDVKWTNVRTNEIVSLLTTTRHHGEIGTISFQKFIIPIQIEGSEKPKKLILDHPLNTNLALQDAEDFLKAFKEAAPKPGEK